MPLYVRKLTDHYPDRDPPLFTSKTEHVVLTGNLVVGTISCVTRVQSEGVWQWGAAMGAGFSTGGTAESLEACKARWRRRLGRF